MGGKGAARSPAIPRAEGGLDLPGGASRVSRIVESRGGDGDAGWKLP